MFPGRIINENGIKNLANINDSDVLHNIKKMINFVINGNRHIKMFNIPVSFTPLYVAFITFGPVKTKFHLSDVLRKNT